MAETVNERKTREVVTPSGYLLTVIDYVTLGDQERMYAEVARQIPEPAENASDAERAAALTLQYQAHRHAWLKIVVQEAVTPGPDPLQYKGGDAILNAVLELWPLHVGEEIYNAVTEVISPKKSEPTASTTSPAAEGKPGEVSSK